MTESLIGFGEHKTQWVTISLDEYESLRRTVDVLSDKDLMKQLEESRKAKSAGGVRDFEEVAKELGI